MRRPLLPVFVAIFVLFQATPRGVNMWTFSIFGCCFSCLCPTSCIVASPNWVFCCVSCWGNGSSFFDNCCYFLNSFVYAHVRRPPRGHKILKSHKICSSVINLWKKSLNLVNVIKNHKNSNIHLSGKENCSIWTVLDC